MDSYKEIFDKRAESYHRAMQNAPMARVEEFNNLIDLLEINNTDTVVDVPCGGAYLHNYLKTNPKIISIDSSSSFVSFAETEVLLCEITDIPLENNSIDKLYSLAGIHHIEDKRSLYKEMYRILKKGGLYGLADIWQGSKVDYFLNEFVDTYNSMGHKGIFLNENTLLEIEETGFKIIDSELKAFYWHFKDKNSMIDFVKGLFGLDKANRQDVEKGITNYLGYIEDENGCHLNWELMYIGAKREN